MTTPVRPTPLWTTATPTSWPEPPAEMTVSTLAEIESCPRRWALSMAAYPELWNERGYPPRVHLKTLAGSVVHAVLETVTKNLARAGCPSVQDESAVAVLQRLGGLSKLVAEAIDQLMGRLATNPRSNRVRDHFTRSLRAQVPELRGRVQTMLCRRHMPQSSAGPAPTGRPRVRGPLANGVYCEIELRAPQFHWRGKADLLALAPDACELTDFKTGEPSEDHQFQLRMYALLWSRDGELNPARRLAGRLVLAYPSGDVEVPAPTADNLDELERQVTNRGAAARQAVAARPPEARPDAQRCRYCGVRQLCDTYWFPETRRTLASQAGQHAFGDIEANIVGRHGPSSWNILVPDPAGTAQPARGLLRTNADIQFEPGDHVRILDAALSGRGREGEDTKVVTLGVLSEVFRHNA